MYWENPSVLMGLWVLPFVAALLIYAHRRRKAAARRFADTAMVARLMPSFQGARPWVKGTLLLTGLGLLIVAGARPRFGEYFEVVSQRGVDLFVLLDVSRSMTAEDVVPNRLERAKSDVRDLLAHLVGDRVGLIVFAGKPLLKVPLTSDQGFFRMVLDEVDTTSAPRGGSLIGDAIRKGLEAMPERRDRDQVIVLITDGEDQNSFPIDAAKQASERSVKMVTVGLGSSGEGSRIPIRDQSGQLRYLKHEGQEVWSKVDGRLLKEIALETGGAYIPAGTQAYDLGAIYVDQTAKLNRGVGQEEKRKRYREQFQPFVCLGVLLLLVDMLIPSYRRPSDEEPRFTTAGMGTRVVLALGLLATIPSPAMAGNGDAAKKVRQGVASFQAQDFVQAAKSFAEADVALPENPWIEYDRACAYQAQGDLEKARELFQRAALSRDVSLAARSHYNLGGLAAEEGRVLFGEKPEDAAPDVRSAGTSLLLSAAKHYRNCLDIDPNHKDARHNLEAIRLWLKHMDALWKEKDRQKNRDEMNLLEFLQMLDAQQRGMRTMTRELMDHAESPQRRQAMINVEEVQRQLAEEIDPLIEKVKETLQPDQQAGPSPHAPATGPPATGQAAPAMSPEMAQKAVELLTKLALDAGQAMTNAADRLDGMLASDALAAQTNAVEKLDEIYMAVVPLPGLVGKAVQTQQGLVDQVTDVVQDNGVDPSQASMADDNSADPQPPADAEQSPSGGELTGPVDAETSTDVEAGEVDHSELAWDQHFIARWTEVLGPKAEQGLKNLPDVNSPNVPLPPQGPSPPGTPDPEAQKKQMEALRKAMEKAVELGPQISTLAKDAESLIDQRKMAAALPKQQEALKLLKEIADLLPKQDQQDQQQQDQKDQQQKDQQQQQKDQQQKNNQEKNEQQQQQQKKQPSEDLSKRQAEAVLRKVRERQRKRRELEKELGRQMVRPGAVEKDW